MKTNILLMSIMLTLLMTGCNTLREYVGLTTYIYVNNSTRDIKITAYSPVKKDGEWVEGKKLSFTIPQGQTYDMKYEYIGTATRPPFMVYEVYQEKDSIKISNGLKYVVEKKSAEVNVLYDLDSYEVVKLEDYDKVFKYTFTDAYFENGEPVTE